MGFVGIRTGSNTSGSRNLQPWLIESNYRQVTLHLGGIYDKQAYEDTGRIEYVSRRGMPKRSVTNRVGAQSSSFGSYNSQRERSGLVGNTPHVYYKNGLNFATNNDTIAGQTIVYDAGLFQNGSYIVLKKRTSNSGTKYWALGVIERADLSIDPEEIVIGYVKNTFVTQIWKSDIYYSEGDSNEHPFKVNFLGVDDDVESPNYGKARYTIIPGTVNNEIPFIGDDYMDISPLPVIYANASGFIILNVTKNENSQYPSPYDITFETELTDDTNTDGYLVLASITKTPADPETNTPAFFTHYSYITGSIICYRVRVGPSNAVYYWSTI